MGQLRHVLLGAKKTDFSRVVWKMPLRSGIVSAALVALSLVVGHPEWAVPAALGSIFVAIADVGEPVQFRLRTMFWTTLWLTAATVIGALVSDNNLWLMLASALMGFACGAIGALGSRAAIAGMLALVVFTIYGGSPELSPVGLTFAVVLGVGALIQTVITLLPSLILNPASLRRTKEREPVIQRLTENFTWTNPFIHHGLRLAAAITLATGLSIYLEKPHSYWIPMTVAWMAKPDHDGTVTRVIARVLGTMGGVLIASLLITQLSLGDPGVIMVIAAGGMVALAFLWANYALSTMGITMFVISLMWLGGGDVHQTSVLDATDALIAGAITVGVSFLWRGTSRLRRQPVPIRLNE